MATKTVKINNTPTGSAAKSQSAKPRGVRKGLGHYLAWACFIFIILITLFPFYWMLRTSFSSNNAMFADPGSLLPVDFNLDAYRRVFGLVPPEEAIKQGGAGVSINFWLYMRNSFIVASVVTVGQTFFSAMAAYAFARLRFVGRDVIFAVFLSALMVPGIFTAMPNFVLIKQLGLLNTFAGICLPTFFMTPFAIFFLRQFFLGIPREIEEAAMIDGAGRFTCFFKVIVPMSSAPITTLAVLTFINQWNEYFWPLLVGQGDNVRVLTVALGIFRSQKPQGAPDWSAMMAATLLAAIPIIILFTILGKKIVNSIGFSGIK